jgi:hypothetical protein
MALKRKIQSIQSENAALRDILDRIRLSSAADAADIFQKLRRTSDPLDVVRYLRHGDVQMMMDNVVAGPQSQIEAEALAASRLSLPARPWTKIAGDGLVSELVSSFFEWEAQNFFLCVEEHSFVADMRLRDPPNAKYCSPMLVNAICALKSVCSWPSLISSITPCSKPPPEPRLWER